MSAQSPALHERMKSALDRWVVRLAGHKRAQLGEIKLTQRLVYILPSRMGLTFLFVLVLMLIAAINYKLALGYALTFLLAAIAWVGLFHCWRNMLGITLRNGRGESVFAGELAQISLTMANPSKLERYAVRLETPSMAQVVDIDLSPNSEQVVRLALHTEKRGWLDCPRFRLSTYFPLGLWRAWAYWHPAVRVLIYPAPEAGAPALPSTSDNGAQGNHYGQGMDDVSALRPYRDGDSPRHIAWKAMARSGTDSLLTKTFEGGSKGELLLDWQALPLSFNTEQRLSRLTRWILDAESSGIEYGLKIPGTHIAPGHGSSHKHTCLSALAMMDLVPLGMHERRKPRTMQSEDETQPVSTREAAR
jgi:uncharacterized protein (DUF58 family)